MHSRLAVRQELGSDVGSASITPIDPTRPFGGRTPDEVYARQANEEKLAA
jgi:hypothetical protein